MKHVLVLSMIGIIGSGIPSVRALAQSKLTGADTIARDSTLPDPVTDALREAQHSATARTVHTGDAMVFPFGRMQPTVTCAVLRACLIELQAGERVWDVVTGDPVRWVIDSARTGPNRETVLVVVKPTACAVTTSLGVTTDRRVYELTLDAPPCPKGASASLNPSMPYARHVRFYYPDDLVAHWSGVEPVASDAHAQPATVAPLRPESLRFAYHMQGDVRLPWYPEAVYDDGTRTYVRLPASAAHEELPVLYAVADDGAKTLMNYTVIAGQAGETLIADRVVARAALALGSGKRERRVEIARSEPDAAHPH